MKIEEALIELNKNPKSAISSMEAGMYSQDYSSLIHWLLIEGSSKLRTKQLAIILKATDWELDAD